MIEENKSKNRFFAGMAALTLGNLFVKLVGLILKIPLHNILGDAGMAYYNNAYDIYAWLFTVATTGLPIAISLSVAENRARGRGKEIRRIFRIAMNLFIVIGLAGSGIMFFGAKLFEEAYKITELHWCIMAVAPTLFFICVASAFRGYFQGYQHMVPTAVSEIIEAVGKLAIGLLFAGYAVKKGYPIHIIAAFAALGLTLGVAAGMIYLTVTMLLFRPEKFDRGLEIAPDEGYVPKPTRAVVYSLLAVALPITVSSSVSSFSAVIDGVILSRRLLSVFDNNQELVKTLIGNYKTLAMPLVNLPIALSGPITASIIPMMRASIASGNKEKARTVLNGSLMLTSIIEMPCAVGMAVLAEPVIKLLFGDNASSENAAPLLSILAVTILFTSMTTVTCGVLQAYGKEKKPIRSVLVGAAVKMVTLFLLVSIPQVNIYGAPLSSIFGSFAISFVNLYYIRKYTGYLPDFVKMLLRPLAASALCGLSAFGLYTVLFPVVGLRIGVVGAIFGAMVVYLLAIFLMKAMTKEDVLLLPKGQKLCSLLTRLRLLR